MAVETHTKADLRDPVGSLDPRADRLWSQWRCPALIEAGPADIARFVLEAVGDRRRDVLEVGCGSGYLALELARAGHHVHAVDPSAESLDIARRTLAQALRPADSGDARVDLTYHEAAFLAWDDGGRRFDALVFNLALHHIGDLPATVARIASLLRPGGRIVVNDFVADRMDSRTIAWLAYQEGALALAAGSPPGATPERLRADLAAQLVEAWHDLHGFDALITALRGAFEQTHFTWEPFMYTRIANKAADLAPDRLAQLVPFMADVERQLIADGAIQAVCYRFVGTAR